MKAYLTVQCQAHCIQYSRPGELYREDCYIHTTRGTMGLFFLFVSTLAICLVCLTPTVHSFTVTSKFNVKCRMTLRNISRVLPTSRVPVRMAESDEEFDENSNDVDDVSDEVLDVLDTEIVPEVAVEEPEVPKEVELDPYEVAVKALEAQLKSEVLMIESLLKSERNSLSKIKDKASESGKNGYFIVQAKVAEFQKNKAVEQKMRVTKNKREFVMKMLPVVDAFRAAPGISPAETEREDSMHKNFGSLLSSILVVFEKYGYKEYDAEIGGTLIPSRHQVAEVIDGEVDGVVSSQLNRGLEDKEGDVLRRALVIATKIPAPVKVVEEAVAEPVEAVAEEVASEE